MSPATMKTLQSNDATTTSLFLIESPSVGFPSIKALKEALRCNTSLEKIHFGIDFLDQMPKNDIKAIMERVGKIESLKEVHFLSGSVEIKSLKSLLDNARKLRVFHLGAVGLEGNAAEFDDLVQALPSSLEELSFAGTRFLYKDVQFHGLLKAIPSVKKLSVLKLAPYYDGKVPESRRISLASSLLVKVLEMPSLRDLHLSQMLLGQLHVGVISWALDRGNLKALELPETGFNDIAAGRLAASLEKSTLERLDLSNNNDLTAEGCTLIAQSLLNNKNIKVLVLAGCKHIGAKGLAALAHVAEKNSGLEHVEAPALADTAPSRRARTASEERKLNNFRATAA